MRYYELTESNAIEQYADMAKEHGLDASDNIAVRNMIEVAIDIRSDCQFYLSQINAGENGGIAWRGMKGSEGSSQSINKFSHLKTRNPLSTEPKLHDYINKQFTKLYGEPYRNAMFMTGSKQDTLRYGYSFQVFPIGKFNFIWSPTVRDLWIAARELRSALMIPKERLGDDEEGRKNKIYIKKTSEEFRDEVLSTYKSDDMVSALLSGREIMVRCERYYAVNFDNMTNNLFDTNKIYPFGHQENIKEELETVFYNIVNNK